MNSSNDARYSLMNLVHIRRSLYRSSDGPVLPKLLKHSPVESTLTTFGGRRISSTATCRT
jgi:hypothetical protein